MMSIAAKAFNSQQKKWIPTIWVVPLIIFHISTWSAQYDKDPASSKVHGSTSPPKGYLAKTCLAMEAREKAHAFDLLTFQNQEGLTKHHVGVTYQISSFSRMWLIEYDHIKQHNLTFIILLI